MKRFIFLTALLILASFSLAFGDCCQADSPSCHCFVDRGAWDPSGAFIQDIALRTVGTTESCLPDGGKPFYQMRLGINDRSQAEFMSCILSMALPVWTMLGTGTAFARDAWCSETVSYWHREAGIPYPSGYRNSESLLDWQLPTTYAIQTFYQVEEETGGRGRWVYWSDLDYNDFRPGENAPLPGSYLVIRRYDASTQDWKGGSHSLMINELTIYRTTSGRIVRVQASLLEGNSSNRVRSDHVFDDLLSLTPAGSEWIGSDRKIAGFGIDLDSHGRPIYDRNRLHWITVRETLVRARRYPKVRDPLWDSKFAPLVHRLVSYSKLVRHGVRVRSEGVKLAGIPDGKTKWYFPRGLRKASVEIDLLAVHPLPIQGLILSWQGRIPAGLKVEWAGADHKFHSAQVPQLDSKLLAVFKGVLPLPVAFGKSPVRVRYVRISLSTKAGSAALTELRFLYDWGPGEDAAKNP